MESQATGKILIEGLGSIGDLTYHCTSLAREIFLDIGNTGDKIPCGLRRRQRAEKNSDGSNRLAIDRVCTGEEKLITDNTTKSRCWDQRVCERVYFAKVKGKSAAVSQC